MISVTEIILIVAGILAVIIGYLIPNGHGVGENEFELTEDKIDEMVRKAIRNSQGQLDELLDESMEDAINKAERAMDRVTNEKMNAISEYSDTVMNDIHKNHDEVMFMYDMLNDKHKNLRNTVSEVNRAAKEVKQTAEEAVLTAEHAEAAARTAKEAALKAESSSSHEDKRYVYGKQKNYSSVDISPGARIVPQRPLVQDNRAAVAGQDNTEIIQDKRRSINAQEIYAAQDKRETVIAPERVMVQETRSNVTAPERVESIEKEAAAITSEKSATAVKPETSDIESTSIKTESVKRTITAIEQMQSGVLPDKQNVIKKSDEADLEFLDDDEEDIRFNDIYKDEPQEDISSGEIADKNAEDFSKLTDLINRADVAGAEKTNKVIGYSADEKVAVGESGNETEIADQTDDPVSRNQRILDMHKQGKSAVVIARELRLGIGEVKLVIDLAGKHNKKNRSSAV